jgi:hypothetical protein
MLPHRPGQRRRTANQAVKLPPSGETQATRCAANGRRRPAMSKTFGGTYAFGPTAPQSPGHGLGSSYAGSVSA